MAEQIASIQISDDSKARLKVLERNLGSGLLERIVKLWGRRSLIIAGYISKTKLSGQSLARRTGQLAQAITGAGEMIDGVPALRVGVFRGPALKYAGPQEEGTKGTNPASPYPDIKPKNAKALAIPQGKALTPAGVDKFGGPRNYPGDLRFIPFQRGRGIGRLVDEADILKLQKKRSKVFGPLNFNDIKTLYLLVAKVKIKGTHYLRDGFNENLETITKELEGFLLSLFESISTT